MSCGAVVRFDMARPETELRRVSGPRYILPQKAVRAHPFHLKTQRQRPTRPFKRSVKLARRDKDHHL